MATADEEITPCDRRRRGVVRPLQDFMQTEASGGAALLLATLAALVLANSALQDLYHDVLTHELTLGFGNLSITEPIEAWVNDALMTIFFFVVGLEIKRELVEGELRDPRTAALPIIAALGGMAVPAVIFSVLNAGEPGSGGWGIPVATDIAFAVGVLTVLGPRVPSSLKIFLLTLAIADDIGGILIIAFFYTAELSLPWLLGAAVAAVGILAMRRLGIRTVPPYAVVGAVMWLATFESGIHATIAGVLLGLMTPVAPVGGRKVLHQLEHWLHPWSSYLVIPLFALTNAGIEISGSAVQSSFEAPLTWGIILGLVVGKTVGVTVFTMAAARLNIGRLPVNVTLRHVLGLGMLAGIGFTVALFIARLSFPGRPELLQDAKMGVMSASLAAALLGSFWLVYVAPRPPRRAVVSEETG